MNVNKIFTQFGTVIALAILFLIFAISVPGFVESSNLINILTQIALLMIIAQGFTMVLIVGELDLSFANLASLSSVVVAGLIIHGMNPILAVLVCFLGGMLFA
jgi:ribose/xylose/arabinose/galactoside ABC-type transport system permease subunit